MSGSYQTAAETTHRCPVCERPYVPATDSAEVDGTGPVFTQIGDVCLKGGQRFYRCYVHTDPDYTD